MPAQRIAIDATVLLAALLCPAGESARLLQLAALGVFQPVIDAAVLAEAERHARMGIAGRVVTEPELLAFRAVVAIAPTPESVEPQPTEIPHELGDTQVLTAARRHGCTLVCVGGDATSTLKAAGLEFLTPSQLLAQLVAGVAT